MTSTIVIPALYNVTTSLVSNTTSVHETEEEILLRYLGPRRREWPIVILLLVIYGVIFVTGVIGNIFTCIVISRTSYMRTSTNYYLFSLAISDVMMLIVGLPPEAYSIWESYPWRFGKAFCIIKALIVEMTSCASILTITAFTIERYIAICKPLVAHKFVAFSRCVKIIIAIWIVSLCSALPYPIHTDLFYYAKDHEGNPIADSLQCNIPPEYNGRMTHVFQTSSCVFFVIPLTLIIVLYSLIGVTLRKADLRRETSDKLCHGNGSRSHPHEGTLSASCAARRSVLKVLVAVVVAFFVCWAPFHAQRLLTAYNTNWTPMMLDLQSSLFYVSGVLYFVGSTVNPILYNVMSRRYRLAFLETICGTKTQNHYYNNSPRLTNGQRSTLLTMKDACTLRSNGHLISNGVHGNGTNTHSILKHQEVLVDYRNVCKCNAERPNGHCKLTSDNSLVTHKPANGSHQNGQVTKNITSAGVIIKEQPTLETARCLQPCVDMYVTDRSDVILVNSDGFRTILSDASKNPPDACNNCQCQSRQSAFV